MKLFNLILFILVALASCSSQNGEQRLTIKGQLKDIPAGTSLYLEEITLTNRKPVDTSTIDRQGDFSMEVALKNSGLYQLRAGETHALFLVLDEKPGSVMIKADTASMRNFGYKVTGSAASEQLRTFIVDMKKYGDQFGQAMSEYQSNVNQTTPDSVRQVYVARVTKADSTFKKFARSYVDTVTNPVIAIFAVTNLNYESDKPVYDKLEATVRQQYSHLPIGQSFLMMLDEQKKQASRDIYTPKYKEGELAPDFEMMDNNNNTMKLSSTRGNYVLLDFWASWCGPCRMENPNIVRAYNKYRDKGFMVFSVSLDNDKEKWIKAIAKDQLAWPYHTSQLKGWNSPICEVYGIRSIPQSYLLDKEGKIIGVNLRGAELDQVLSQLFP